MNKNLAAVKNKPNCLKNHSNYGSEMTKIKFMPLKKETWKDFEDLFGERGACRLHLPGRDFRLHL
jgi:Tat protein secretion system quality control protein TatD with DNase activity